MDIDNLEYPFQFFIEILVQNPLSHPLKLTNALVGYSQQDVPLKDYQTTMLRFNKDSEFMDAYAANYSTNGTSQKTLLFQFN